MMRNIGFLILFFLISTHSHFLHHSEEEQEAFSSFQELHQTQEWFSDQLVDHLSPLNNLTFRQRYWIMDDFYDHDKGPAILLICGEYTCQGVRSDRQFPAVLAKEFKGIIFVLEHRFYGESQPFGVDSWSIDNLRYLNVEQALNDLAYFSLFCIQNAKGGIKTTTPWISIGGSYPGALSAWYRAKFPHLSIGSLASSAVVNSILNFIDFDRQVRISALKSGPECPEAIINITKYAEDQLADPGKAQEFKEQFIDAGKLTNQEFLFYLADIFVLMVQYGKRTMLCDMMKGKTLAEQFTAIKDYANKNNRPYEYGTYYLKNQTVDYNKNYRQWYYQCCSEVGWLQTADYNDTPAMRSKQVSIEFFQQWCADAYGPWIWPNTNNTNSKYGGLNIQSHNLIFTNGCEDPWKRSSILKNRTTLLAFEIDCDDCGHCIDLHTPNATDPLSLNSTRQAIQDNMQKWLNSYYSLITDS